MKCHNSRTDPRTRTDPVVSSVGPETIDLSVPMGNGMADRLGTFCFFGSIGQALNQHSRLTVLKMFTGLSPNTVIS